MRLIFFVCFVSIVTCASSQGTGKDSVEHFAGTTPCSNIIRPLHKINLDEDCELNKCKCIMVEWKLLLYRNSVTKEPTSYKLTSINRYSEPETNMYSQPGTKTESEGKWTIIKGTKTNPSAMVYRLNPDKTEISLSLLKLGDSLLHVLDPAGRLMIGNEFWNYTLTGIKTKE